MVLDVCPGVCVFSLLSFLFLTDISDTIHMSVFPSHLPKARIFFCYEDLFGVFRHNIAISMPVCLCACLIMGLL